MSLADEFDQITSRGPRPVKRKKVAADQTAVARPDYREAGRLKQKADSLKTEHDSAFKRVVDRYNGKASPATFLGEAVVGDTDARTTLRTERELKANRDSVASANKRRVR